MQAAHYEGLEVLPSSDPEAIKSGQHQDHFPTAASAAGGTHQTRVCRLSRTTFWLVVGMGILAASIIGLGAGLGVALSKAQGQNASISTSASTNLGESGPSVSSSTPSANTQTSWAPTSTSSNVPQPSSICPAANGTSFSASLGALRYRVACDSDFGSSSSSSSSSSRQELGSFAAPRWEDCVELCNTMNYFQNRTDVGCVWDVAGIIPRNSTTRTPATCRCIGGEGKTVVVSPGRVAGVPRTVFLGYPNAD